MRGEFCCGGTVESAYGQRVCAPAALAVAAHQPGTNFACNSPQGISSYELKPLKFCRFRAVVHVASAGIACDFWRAGEVCFDHWPRDGMWPEGAALTHAAAYGGERRVRHASLRLTAAGWRARPQRMAGAPCSSVTMR